MRGKHDGLLNDDAVIGITPADAGKTNLQPPHRLLL